MDLLTDRETDDGHNTTPSATSCMGYIKKRRHCKAFSNSSDKRFKTFAYKIRKIDFVNYGKSFLTNG